MINTPNATPLACIVLAAGQGTRMRSELTKVLHPVAGLPMIALVAKTCTELSPDRIVFVISPDAEAVKEAVAPHPCVIQEKPLGTGDAVKATRGALTGFEGDVIVLFGDTPLVTSQSLQTLRNTRKESGAAIVVSGFTPEDPGPYGRLIVNGEGRLMEIVEANDATPEQRRIKLCNGGIMLFEAAKLWPLLEQLRSDNVKNEFYLTDCIKLARGQGWPCVVAELPAEDVIGINTRVELAKAEKLLQNRLRHAAMLGGVTMIDPDTVFLGADTKLGEDVTIWPHVIFGSGVEVADDVEIRSFCHLVQTRVQTGAVIGPFARMRPGTTVGTNVRIGNFVEIKNTQIGANAKINHLSYIGDATIGSRVNVGAGTITCNYDGYQKSRTEIGAGAFIGSNTALVAPVKVGSGAYVGAGSVITQNVASDALSVARGKQEILPDWARRYREGREQQTEFGQSGDDET
jgi:bifunctional UDP-N-acetylglucosamine pyrophosphorylase / glucosamine-1-phosphate N-acetyltransferase